MQKSERKCLFCYDPLENETGDFHEKCSRSFFGSPVPPEINFGLEDVEGMAVKVLGRSQSVTGVQPKLSLELGPTEKDRNKKRLTIVNLWGSYILKPPIVNFPQMTEAEDLTMHLSALMKIPTAQHSLIRLKSGELAYISKRFDRAGRYRLQAEDMAQLTGTLTENKYKSSMEKTGRIILKYSTNNKFDILTFFELTLFCFLTGNADMHLKNFSLLTNEDEEIALAPAYDLLPTKLLTPKDPEEMALTINGRKNNLRKKDFDLLAEKLGINERSRDNSYRKFFTGKDSMLTFIDKSFLSEDYRKRYKELISERFARL
ncbi:MAG: HipA domain-containing protein [Syntrophothermus sp.]